MKNAYMQNLMDRIRNQEEVSGGECILARVYENSIKKKCESLVFDDILWEWDAESFVLALQASGVNELYITGQSSNILDTFLMLDELGLHFCGIVQLDNADYKQDVERWEYSIWSPTIPALKFSFKEGMS